MKSNTGKISREKKRNRDGLDMAAKAVAEYEEAQRRRDQETIDGAVQAFEAQGWTVSREEER